MATVINNPSGTTSDSNGNTGLLLGIILIIAVVVLLFYFGLPVLRGSGVGGGASVGGNTPSVNINTPNK